MDEIDPQSAVEFREFKNKRIYAQSELGPLAQNYVGERLVLVNQMLKARRFDDLASAVEAKKAGQEIPQWNDIRNFIGVAYETARRGEVVPQWEQMKVQPFCEVEADDLILGTSCILGYIDSGSYLLSFGNGKFAQCTLRGGKGVLDSRNVFSSYAAENITASYQHGSQFILGDDEGTIKIFDPRSPYDSLEGGLVSAGKPLIGIGMYNEELISVSSISKVFMRRGEDIIRASLKQYNGLVIRGPHTMRVLPTGEMIVLSKDALELFKLSDWNYVDRSLKSSRRYTVQGSPVNKGVILGDGGSILCSDQFIDGIDYVPYVGCESHEVMSLWQDNNSESISKIRQGPGHTAIVCTVDGLESKLYVVDFDARKIHKPWNIPYIITDYAYSGDGKISILSTEFTQEMGKSDRVFLQVIEEDLSRYA